jgi:hypothetical protein
MGRFSGVEDDENDRGNYLTLLTFLVVKEIMLYSIPNIV